MKPPSTVEARVAEELRNWLSSELEQLDASNTNQFAHHVVTILLHEDLDIEDEPLSSGDDFLRDIYSIRRGKTRDKQKKAAVQFLRSAVCCNDPGEADIQGVVDELMVKIEETKIRMNSKCSPKRISANGHSSVGQPGTRSDLHDRQRLYNEAFPSLHSSSSNSSSVWHALAVTAADGCRGAADGCRGAAGQCGLQADSAHGVLVFDSQEEAHACNTARRVFVSTLPETALPSFEATEVLASPEPVTSLELYSLTDAYRCWSTHSAFQACSLLRKFLPTTSPLKQVSQPDVQHRSFKDFSPTVIPVINQSDLQSINLDPSYEKTLTDHPQLFRPIKERSYVNDFRDIPLSETDLEVARIFNSKHNGKQAKNKCSKPESPVLVLTFDGGGSEVSCHLGIASAEHQSLREGTSTEDGVSLHFSLGRVSSADKKLEKADMGSLNVESKCRQPTEALNNDCHRKCSPDSKDIAFSPHKLWDISYKSRETSEIDDVCTFPQHHGGFWKHLTEAGSMALYPVVSNQLVFDLEEKFEAHRKCVTSPLTSYQTLSVKNAADCTQCRYSSDVWPDLACGRWMLESACVQVQYQYAVRQTAHVQQMHISHLQQASLQNPFMPSLLGSCLSNEGSQILQRAFVNSYFSDSFQEPLANTRDTLAGIRCSDLEDCWLSTEMLEVGGLGQAKTEVVPGCTCSSWLEDNCHLGDLCPFSHPSI